MIPVKDSLTQIDNLPGEEIAFGIGDPRWVMRTQAELYSDVTTAIIREYSTNAHDANVMAGNDDPIEVTLPSMMNPYFTVEDKGVGMNLEDFKQIYTQFGTSNKRDSNSTNGMLGYGSKSGVAYTTSFQVTSIKDGMKIHGVIQRKPDWSIVLKIVFHSKTIEPNGTKIVIPVHNVEEFNHKANEFYKFWLPGRVLINGKAPEHFAGEKIVDGLYYSEEWNTSRIVMGNVAYRINNPAALFYNTKMNHINFVAYVDNGDVEFTPSREDLAYSEHTKAALQKVVNDFEEKIIDSAKDEINGAANHAEAYLAWKKWTSRLGRDLFDDLEFKGDKLVHEFDCEGVRYYPNGYRGNTTMAVNKWRVDQDADTIYVTNFDVKLATRHKAMVKEYAKQQGWDFTYALFTPSDGSDIDSPWIRRAMTVSFADMKAACPVVRKQRSTNSWHPNTGRVAGSWDYFTSIGRVNEEPIPVPSDDGEVFYIGVKEGRDYDVPAILRYMGDVDSVVILVPANRKAKFLRENPKVNEFLAHAKSKVVTDGGSLLSDDAKKLLDAGMFTRRWVLKLNANKIDDPEWSEYKRLIENESKLLKAYNNNLSLARALKMWYSVSEYNSGDEDYVAARYPLIKNLSIYLNDVDEDIYIYLNARYAADKDKNDE